MGKYLLSQPLEWCVCPCVCEGVKVCVCVSGFMTDVGVQLMWNTLNKMMNKFNTHSPCHTHTHMVNSFEELFVIIREDRAGQGYIMSVFIRDITPPVQTHTALVSLSGPSLYVSG